jgi:hypothetical protein
VVVSVEIIQRSVSVDVAACDGEPVRDFPQRQLYKAFAPLTARINQQMPRVSTASDDPSFVPIRASFNLISSR